MHNQFLQSMNNRLVICTGNLLAFLALLASPTLFADQIDQADAVEPAAESTQVLVETAAVEDPQAIDIAEQDEELIDLDELADQAEQDTAYEELYKDGILLDRLEVRSTFWEYFDSEQYEQAVDAGELVVKMTEKEFGPADLEMAPVLNGLGTAMFRAGRPAEAAPYFERSISVYQDQIGIFAPELVDPLVGLGLSQQVLGEHDDALDTFQRAQHLTHRDKGVYNLDQVAIIQARSQSYMAKEKWDEAENLQLLAAKLYRRQYGEGNPETIPAMLRLANWYEDVMDYRQARVIYRKAIKMIEEQGGGDSPAMIPALQGIASAYLAEHAPDMGKGLKAREKIVAIANNHPGYDAEDLILAHLELGDWYVMFNSENKAWKHYRIGWEMSVEREEELTRDWPSYFDRPHLIYAGASLSLDLMGMGVIGKLVYYEFKFTIGRNGRPKDIDILSSNLHGQTRSAAIHAFRYARFRPRVVDGSTVATEDYKVRRVYPTEAPEGYETLKVKLGTRSGL